MDQGPTIQVKSKGDSRTHVGPGVEHYWKPRTRIQNTPKHHRHQDWKCYHRGVENGMCRLKGARPAPQPRCAGPGIGEAMQAAEEKIKGQAPIGQVGEVGKGATGVLRMTVRIVPAEDDEDGGEGPERKRETQEGENGRRK